MTTTDTDALTERIARVLHEIDPITGHGHDWGKLSNVERKFYRHKAAAVLPIVAEEVRKAKAEALREAAEDLFYDGDNDRPMYGCHELYDRADRIETGDSDDHR